MRLDQSRFNVMRVGTVTARAMQRDKDVMYANHHISTLTWRTLMPAKVAWLGFKINCSQRC